MATYNVFDDFSEHLVNGVHNLGTGTIKLFVCGDATPPVASDSALADLSAKEIDYTNLAGGANPIVAITRGTAADVVLSADKITLTASGGALPTFQCYGLYNDSATSPADALICWWDHGAPVTLSDAEQFEIKFDNQDVAGTIMTIGDGTISA